ncbi:DMT family transporter [Acinetobacter sp. c1-l78]|uniref:DMT family transporter n=1 Tax=Acinetobacter sp. c1-l78 TaxID=3342803 RepID=UPI0035BB90C7
MLWVWFSLLAALMQAGRNAFQKQLSVNVPIMGVTLARFLFACPLALGYLLIHYYHQPNLTIPSFSGKFVFYIIFASVAQILATALMVRLFRLKNYSIGAGLAKSEAILTAILGVLLFGTQIGWLGWVGIVIGSIAVFLMSVVNNLQQISWQTLWLGLASGLCFAFTSLSVREASLLLDLPSLVAASWVLFAVITVEAVGLTLYLWFKERHVLQLLMRYRNLTIATSVFSFLGSLGWFSAMSLQHVAFVKTVGQIEVFFMILISLFIFKEKLKRNDLIGLLLIVVAAILVVWS